MTATILLIRHAAHAHLGTILSGRQEGLSLTDQGRNDAERLAARLAIEPIVAVQSSPVQRARETAEAIADASALGVELVDALDEIDFGVWTGRGFAELEHDSDWREWNERRSTAVVPKGESMAQAQARAMAHLRQTASRHDGATLAMVTHCDIIRAVLTEILGISLDGIHRFEVGPASVSRVVVSRGDMRVQSMNEILP